MAPPPVGERVRCPVEPGFKKTMVQSGPRGGLEIVGNKYFPAQIVAEAPSGFTGTPRLSPAVLPSLRNCGDVGEMWFGPLLFKGVVENYFCCVSACFGYRPIRGKRRFFAVLHRLRVGCAESGKSGGQEYEMETMLRDTHCYWSDAKYVACSVGRNDIR